MLSCRAQRRAGTRQVPWPCGYHAFTGGDAETPRTDVRRPTRAAGGGSEGPTPGPRPRAGSRLLPVSALCALVLLHVPAPGAPRGSHSPHFSCRLLTLEPPAGPSPRGRGGRSRPVTRPPGARGGGDLNPGLPDSRDAAFPPWRCVAARPGPSGGTLGTPPLAVPHPHAARLVWTPRCRRCRGCPAGHTQDGLRAAGPSGLRGTQRALVGTRETSSPPSVPLRGTAWLNGREAPSSRESLAEEAESILS